MKDDYTESYRLTPKIPGGLKNGAARYFCCLAIAPALHSSLGQCPFFAVQIDDRLDVLHIFKGSHVAAVVIPDGAIGYQDEFAHRAEPHRFAFFGA